FDQAAGHAEIIGRSAMQVREHGDRFFGLTFLQPAASLLRRDIGRRNVAASATERHGSGDQLRPARQTETPLARLHVIGSAPCLSSLRAPFPTPSMPRAAIASSRSPPLPPSSRLWVMITFRTWRISVSRSSSVYCEASIGSPIFTAIWPGRILQDR